MKWFYLLVAGALEITWAVTMKMSEGFTVLIPSIITGIGYIDKLTKVLVDGDMLIVTKLDRIARSTIQGIDLIENLLGKGVVVHVLNIGIMDNSPAGKLIRNIFLAFAEFERDMIVERTQEGKAIAKGKKGYKEGRPKKYTKKQMDHAMKLLETHSYKQVSEMTGIVASSLVREKTERKRKKIMMEGDG